MGGAFGETGIKDGTMNWLVGDQVASSIPYFCGWMASGYFVVGDIRDIGETLYQGDGVGTALNAAAFLPAVGDGEKLLKNTVEYAIKYPAKITDHGRKLIRAGLLDKIPDSQKLEFIRICWGDVGTNLLKSGKNTANDLVTAVKKNPNLKIDEIHSVENILGETRILTKERYTHIDVRHMRGTEDGGQVTHFFPTGVEIKRTVNNQEISITTPNAMTPANVENLISESMRRNPIGQEGRYLIYEYNPNNYGITNMRTVVDAETGIVRTSYPLKGPNVKFWDKKNQVFG